METQDDPSKDQAENNSATSEIPTTSSQAQTLGKLGGKELDPIASAAIEIPAEAENREPSKEPENPPPAATADDQSEALQNAHSRHDETDQTRLLAELQERTKTQETKISELLEAHRKLLKERQEEQDQHIKSMNALESDLRGQIEKMTQIISQLHSRGLPQAPDDGYLQRALDDIVHDIMQFARAFTRGQDTLTWEMLSACKTKLNRDMQKYLHQRFKNLKSLALSQNPNVGAKVRTRCVQVIMIRRLMSGLLWDRPIGFPKEFRDMIMERFGSNMRCSDEEFQAWKALTVHRLVKDNPAFIQEQKVGIDRVTDTLYEQIAPWGEFKRVNKKGLTDIVVKTAKLGIELARLPFGVAPLPLSPETLFDHQQMVDVEEEMDEDSAPKMTTIILSLPWVKVIYTEDGKEVLDKNNLLCKAQVSCLN